ncbi:hypothetical protein, partial [Amycolatopsis dongchuanensis]|uniref:hypothetical protein n=1 Tax=Amycolatopsis dongchuanensis TaxID=1070866 RepID=UPI0031F889D3
QHDQLPDRPAAHRVTRHPFAVGRSLAGQETHAVGVRSRVEITRDDARRGPAELRVELGGGRTWATRAASESRRHDDFATMKRTSRPLGSGTVAAIARSAVMPCGSSIPSIDVGSQRDASTEPAVGVERRTSVWCAV